MLTDLGLNFDEKKFYLNIWMEIKNWIHTIGMNYNLLNKSLFAMKHVFFFQEKEGVDSVDYNSNFFWY